MGLWRALIVRARGSPRYLSPAFGSSSPPSSSAFSSFIPAKSEQQHQPCTIPRFETPSDDPHEVCARLNEHIWPGLDEGFPSLVSAQRNGMQNVEALLEDAENFLLDLSGTERLGRLNIRSLEGSLQIFEQKKALPIATRSAFVAGTISLEKSLYAGRSLEDAKALTMSFLKQNGHKQSENLSVQFSVCNSALRAPGFSGTKDLVIHADSVKRKRKKKMNKHKHRKLRRLARKSKK